MGNGILLGRFHEISVATADIRASVEFYERLGFSQLTTGDTWPHPYGALTDGRIALGLHQQNFASPSITFVKPGIAAQMPALAAFGIEFAFAKTGDDCFNELGFRDPAGQAVRILEARTYSPSDRGRDQPSLCGDFAELSIPATDFAAARGFWERLGFVALEESDTPYRHVPLTSDYLNLAFHAPQTLDRPMLVFRDSGAVERLRRLRDLNVPFAPELPRGLDPERHALLKSPEGTPLLLLSEGD
jgi:catechol 2,3-dioxygenase-like lactoylglutathione lyase family enzyme